MLAIVGSTVCAAAAGVATKRHGAALHPAALNAPAMLIGAGALAVVSLVVGDGLQVPRDTSTWAAIGYLAIAGSVITFLGYFTLLKTWSVTSLSFISVFTPAIALILGFVFLDERPTIANGVGGALILGGVALALTERAPVTSERLNSQLRKPNSQVSIEVGSWKLGIDLFLLLRRSAGRRSAEEQTRSIRQHEVPADGLSPPSFAR